MMAISESSAMWGMELNPPCSQTERGAGGQEEGEGEEACSRTTVPREAEEVILIDQEVVGIPVKGEVNEVRPRISRKMRETNEYTTLHDS